MTLPVVLQHGAGQDAETWAEVLPLVPGEVRVHESPGHGARPGPPLDDLDALAADLLADLPGPEGRPVVLCGHSLGGAIVLAAALKAPDRVAGVVTVATGIPGPIDPRMMTALEAGRIDEVAHLVRLSVVGMRRDPDPRHVASADRILAVWKRIGAEAIAADYRAVDTSGLADRLEALRVPTAVLAGGADGLVTPRRVRMLAEALGVEAEVVPDVTHQLVWEAPDAVAGAIARVRAAAEG